MDSDDMVALGAKYYANCLASLYNRARELDREKFSEKNSQAVAHSITQAKSICQIQDCRKEQLHSTVYKLTDLKKRILQVGSARRRDRGNTRNTLYVFKGKGDGSFSWIDS